MLRADAVKDEYVLNEAKPTRQEKEAIKVWLEVREQAQAYQASQRGAPSPELAKTRLYVTDAIYQLYTGRLTYGAFARRVRALDAEYQAVGQAQSTSP